MNTIPMELRAADVSRREIVGEVIPYDTTTYLVRDPNGEQIARGAFAKSISERRSRIPLFVNHDHSLIHGLSTEWHDEPGSLLGTFKVKEGSAGDQILADARDGYWPGLSIDFAPVITGRDRDGVGIVKEGKLLGVSLVTIPAYDTARVLATRAADITGEPDEPTFTRIDVAALFGPAPEIDLSPIARFW